ncbi:SecY-interacting protein Syd [Oceanobacillus senegalensis]|uniref:SecY-interacting protein Syd n=1 Tax=Oceanobacillus senegalensis TaxID=1936063 RepID=UPI001FE3C7DE|nr:SecY-interacting protein Syd [Oceanobacillus senegalensis]
MENEFGIKFHNSIVEYFNSYWFAELDGFIKNYYVKLEPVLPDYELNSFSDLLNGYRNNHQNKLNYIPLGMEGNGLLVVIDNSSGKVYLEDFERKNFEYMIDDIAALINNLRLWKGNLDS